METVVENKSSAAIYLAARKSVLGLGKVVTLAGVLLGIAIVAISFAQTVWLSALICIPIGFCIIANVASINTLLQTLSDEDKRGRVMGYLAMTFTGITPLGSMFLGFLESYIGLSHIILISGCACIISALIFEHYRPLVPKHARLVYIEKGIIPEIAVGIAASEEKDF